MKLFWVLFNSAWLYGYKIFPSFVTVPYNILWRITLGILLYQRWERMDTSCRDIPDIHNIHRCYIKYLFYKFCRFHGKVPAVKSVLVKLQVYQKRLHLCHRTSPDDCFVSIADWWIYLKKHLVESRSLKSPNDLFKSMWLKLNVPCQTLLCRADITLVQYIGTNIAIIYCLFSVAIFNKRWR